MEQKLDECVLMREEEKPTLDGLHELCFLLAGNNLSFAPVSRPRQVLDLGSGTGLWMKQFAETQNPEKVVGLDLMKPPKSTSFPPSCQFVTADLEKHWQLTDKFDYIHARFLVGCLFDWPRFFEQCYDTLSPGGWFEIFDVHFPAQSDDDTLLPTSKLAQWNQILIKAAQKSGRELTVAAQFKELMAEAGFRNLTEVRYKVPQNPWPADAEGRRLGEITLPIHQAGHERLGVDYLCGQLGIPEEEVKERLVDVLKDMEDRTIHGWWPFYAVYGQKPMEE